MRVALYARFSSDLQRQTSIDDQLRAARARAAGEGWHVAIERRDEAVSGATPVALRPGGKALMADALAGRFDVLIVEGLDRLSRDIGEQDQVVKRLEYRGIRIIGTSDGYDTQAKGRKVMRVARGLVNELYLDDLRDKTRRGLAGNFERGMSAGGRSYGYRTEAANGGRRLVVEHSEAEIVREVFQRYVDGWSPVAIAHDLNRRGIPSARGGTWAVSALYGSAERGLGMLNNALYAGRLIWNRRQWLKDPETGARRYVERPRAEWMERDAPELRIVDEALWQAARARMTGVPGFQQRVQTSRARGRPPRTLWGGTLRCPACDGAIVAIDSRRYGCSVHKDRGAAVCTNSATVPRKSIDTRLLAFVREVLDAPAALAELQREVRSALAEQQRDAAKAGGDVRRRLAECDAEIARLVDALARIGYSDGIGARLRTLETERAALATSQAAAELPDVEEIVALVTGRYRASMLELQRRLEAEPDRERTRELLRQIVGPVRLVRDAEGVTWAEMTNPAEQLMAAGGAPINVVARAGFATWRRVRAHG